MLLSPNHHGNISRRFRVSSRLREAKPSEQIAKEFRKLQLEHLLASSILDSNRFAGAAEMAKELGVTPRTVRNYLRERRLALFGPDRVTVHWYADEAFTNQTAVEVLTMDEYAQKLGISTRELSMKATYRNKKRILKPLKNELLAKVLPLFRRTPRHMGLRSGNIYSRTTSVAGLSARSPRKTG